MKGNLAILNRSSHDQLLFIAGGIQLSMLFLFNLVFQFKWKPFSEVPNENI